MWKIVLTVTPNGAMRAALYKRYWFILFFYLIHDDFLGLGELQYQLVINKVEDWIDCINKEGGEVIVVDETGMNKSSKEKTD